MNAPSAQRDPAVTAEIKAARAAVESAARHESQAAHDRAARDASLRRLKAAGLTVREIADATGVNFHTIKLAIR